MRGLQRSRTRHWRTRLLLSLTVLAGVAIATELAIIALWRWGGEAPRHRVARFNKRWTNPLARTALRAGRRHSPYAVIRHTGRRSGRTYRTPVVAQPVDGAFLIPLAYGEQVDWYRNVQASGGCTLEWQGALYALGTPVRVPAETALRVLPRRWRVPIHLYGIQEFISLPVTALTQLGGIPPSSTHIERPATHAGPRRPRARPARADREERPVAGVNGGTTSRTAMDIWQAARSTPEALAARQWTRLAALVAYARTHAPYYQDLYRHVSTEIADVRMLPAVTK